MCCAGINELVNTQTPGEGSWAGAGLAFRPSKKKREGLSVGLWGKTGDGVKKKRGWCAGGVVCVRCC